MANALLPTPRAGITATESEGIVFFGCGADEETDLCDTCTMVKPSSQISMTDERGNTVCDECAEGLDPEEDGK